MEQALSLLLPGPPFTNLTSRAIKLEMHKQIKTIVWLRRFFCEKHNEFNSPNIKEIPADVCVNPIFVLRMENLIRQIQKVRLMPKNTEQEKEAAIDALMAVQEALLHEVTICQW
jgi:hypothetical protein